MTRPVSRVIFDPKMQRNFKYLSAVRSVLQSHSRMGLTAHLSTAYKTPSNQRFATSTAQFSTFSSRSSVPPTASDGEDIDIDSTTMSRNDVRRVEKQVDQRKFDREAAAYGAKTRKIGSETVYYFADEPDDGFTQYTAEDYARARQQAEEEERLERAARAETTEGRTADAIEEEQVEMAVNPEVYAAREQYAPMFNEDMHDEPLTPEERELTPEEQVKLLQKRILRNKGRRLPQDWAQFKTHAIHLIKEDKLDKAALHIFTKIHSTTSEPVPRAVYASLLNVLLPTVPHILGLPLTKPVFAAGAPDLIIMLLEKALEQGYTFSDVEWRQALRSIAGEATTENRDEVLARMHRMLGLFRNTTVFRGHTVYRTTSTSIGAVQNATRKLANLHAAHATVIEQEAWLIFFTSIKHPLAVEAFRHIHNASVYCMGNGPDFVLPAVADQLRAQGAEHPAVPATEHARYLKQDKLSFSQLDKGWVSKRHHPDLYNYPRPDVDYMGFLSATDDILDNPFLYQPPHVKDAHLPRISIDLRDDQTALFPSAIVLMRMFCDPAAGNIAQAEAFFKHMTRVLINTEKYYSLVNTNLDLIDQFRESHDYDPDVDYDMAQGLAAPEGEEFRYFAGLERPSIHAQIAYRNRCAHFISQMTEALVRFYKYERRPGAIETLLEYVYKQHGRYPHLFPVPSMFVIQLFIDSCIEAQDIARARKWMRTLDRILQNLPTTPNDPLLQSVLERVRAKRERMQRKHDKTAEVAVSTNHRFKDKVVKAPSERVLELLQKTQQLRFHSLRIEMTAHVVYARAAIAAATHDMRVLRDIITKDMANVHFPSHFRARVFGCVFKRLMHASRTGRNDLTVGHHVYEQYDKTLRATVDPVDCARLLARKGASPEVMARLEAVSGEYLKQLLKPAELSMDLTLSTLTPGHVLELLYQAQRQGVVITDNMISYIFALICMFPDNIGNVAAYKLFKDLPALGVKPSAAIFNRLMEAAAMHAQLRFKFTTSHTGESGSKPLETVFHRSDDPFAMARALSLEHPAYSWLTPDNLFALMQQHDITPDFRSYKYAIMYHALLRNWERAEHFYILAMNQAYFGSYALTVELARTQGLSLAKITNELGYEDRLIVNEARMTLLVRAGAVQERRLVYRVVRDLEEAEDITLWPHIPQGVFVGAKPLVGPKIDLAPEAHAHVVAQLQHVARVDTIGTSRHLRLHNRPQDLSTIHNIILLNMAQENGADFIQHRKFMELAGIKPNMETFFKSLYLAAKQAVFPGPRRRAQVEWAIAAGQSQRDAVRTARAVTVCDEHGSESIMSRSMAVLPTIATCAQGVPVDLAVANEFQVKRRFNVKTNEELFRAFTPRYDTRVIDIFTEVAEDNKCQAFANAYPAVASRTKEDIVEAVRKHAYGALDFRAFRNETSEGKLPLVSFSPGNASDCPVPAQLLQLHESHTVRRVPALGAAHVDMVLQEMLVRDIPIIPRVLHHVVVNLFRTNTKSYLLALPYYSALAQLIDAVPLLDARGRAQHQHARLSSLSTGDLLVEEELFENALGEVKAVDKLFGKYVVYQHEVVNSGLQLIEGLGQQASLVLSMQRQLVEQAAAHDIDAHQRASEATRLHGLLSKTLHGITHAYTLVEDFLPPSDAADTDISLSNLLALPLEKPRHFTAEGIKPPKHSNYTNSATHLVDRALLRKALATIASVPTIAQSSRDLLRDTFQAPVLNGEQSVDVSSVALTAPLVDLSAHEYEQLLCAALRHKRYTVIPDLLTQWLGDAQYLLSQYEHWTAVQLPSAAIMADATAVLLRGLRPSATCEVVIDKLLQACLDNAGEEPPTLIANIADAALAVKLALPDILDTLDNATDPVAAAVTGANGVTDAVPRTRRDYYVTVLPTPYKPATTPHESLKAYSSEVARVLQVMRAHPDYLSTVVKAPSVNFDVFTKLSLQLREQVQQLGESGQKQVVGDAKKPSRATFIYTNV